MKYTYGTTDLDLHATSDYLSRYIFDVFEYYYLNKSSSRQIPVSELRIGMFVSQLDRDWLDTPFLLQGFQIETEEDIDVVAQHCRHVWVDDAHHKKSSRAIEHAVLAGHKKPTRYINQVPSQQEHRQALGVYTRARTITKSLMDSVVLQGVINTQEAKSVVNECVQSVIRNPNALMWMSKIREVDAYTSEHCLNVCIYAITFGRHLGLPPEELETLGLCALLHDVGKMRVPNDILNKPGPLTPKEYNAIKAHTVHGRNLLMSSPGMIPAAVDVAYSHHEHMDGSGYPRKIKASGTPTFSRIVAIVDAYDAITADRCYAPAQTPTEALNIIYKNRGSHFDEYLAKEFIRCVGIYPPGTLVELKNGMVGIVLSTNKKFSRLPKIIVVLDDQKKPCKERVYDLAEVHYERLSKGYLIVKTLTDGAYGVTLKAYKDKGLTVDTL